VERLADACMPSSICVNEMRGVTKEKPKIFVECNDVVGGVETSQAMFMFMYNSAKLKKYKLEKYKMK
jgi:hypothetical protein